MREPSGSEQAVNELSPDLRPGTLSTLQPFLRPLCSGHVHYFHIYKCNLSFPPPVSLSLILSLGLLSLYLLPGLGALLAGHPAPYPHTPQCLHLQESRQMFLVFMPGLDDVINQQLPSHPHILCQRSNHGMARTLKLRVEQGLV